MSVDVCLIKIYMRKAACQFKMELAGSLFCI